MKSTLLILTLLITCLGLKAQDLKLGLPVGHTSGVYSAVFSPDGTKILTGSSDKTARLWESSSGKLIHSLEGHTSGVNSAVFSVRIKIDYIFRLLLKLNYKLFI